MTFNVLSLISLVCGLWMLPLLCEEWLSLENSYERNFLHGWNCIILFIDKYVFGFFWFAFAIFAIVFAVMPYGDQLRVVQFVNSLNLLP